MIWLIGIAVCLVIAGASFWFGYMHGKSDAEIDQAEKDIAEKEDY